ncbi:MAG: FAD-dependent oxidoreductase [Candidatus Obscuribacterales bacterium]|nr:FAD-dependent oxidoreductase [Candidatus Obscuribacterales bacterium]
MKRIIVVGGGFGGVKCARTLRKELPLNEFQIVVFNKENHMVFHPLLAEVVSASVQPKDVGAPLRQLLTGVQCRTEDVTNIDFNNKDLFYEAHDGQIRSMKYDYLVLTCGNTVNLSLVPGMDEHAYPLKTIGDALTLQAHVMEQMEKAEVCENLERKRWYLTFVVVGGGFSGVEVAGEINDLVRSSLRFFSYIKKEDIRVVIVHSRDELLPEVSQNLRKFTKKKMEQSGVETMLNLRATMCTPEGLRLSDDTFLSAGTVVCTVGTTTQALVKKLDAPKDRGKLKTDATMSISERKDAWAFGDCANVVNALDGAVCPPVAQFAERQGVQAAKNIVAAIKGKEQKPFSFQMQGQLCSIGGRSAVAEIFDFRVSGFLAWFMWRGIYLMKLPSIPQQIKVGIEWACDLVFPRTLAHLRADRTRRIAKSYYAPGDFVFKRGDSATEFYVIEKGEVEILKHDENDELCTECIAVLGPGDFFGESSLLNRTARNHTVKAKSELVCTVLGSNVFTQISSAMIPLRDAVAKAAKRRISMWKNIPDVRALLDSVAISAVVEPLPIPPIGLTSSVEDAIALMNSHTADLCVVADKDGFLAGVITRSDLLRAVEKAALADPDEDVPVTEIMVRDPIAIAGNEPLAVAIATMREHDLKQIIVLEGAKKRIPVGRIRIEKVIELVLKETLAAKQKEVAATQTANVP